MTGDWLSDDPASKSALPEVELSLEENIDPADLNQEDTAARVAQLGSNGVDPAPPVLTTSPAKNALAPPGDPDVLLWVLLGALLSVVLLELLALLDQRRYPQ
eukprot:CAMPEP_0119114678 /NCGR_PEP_ID=MMETSP1180-20130426/48261_1 /TAXON_ID=3052 ORGANISM="Chlamydomonas cf sp, Strain CCMP681" /NCGR_SAMPLE_ID=MMETSP1180 /ASSEMBLY_ACC=CAM_ASM_000741 /LENGTH=101 /DNA_ID=CAMNT_0007103331 /DNA_START=422 /DNA_END=728 /DNA_ORIENTATION=+